MGRHVVSWLPLVLATLAACANSSDNSNFNNSHEGGTSGSGSSSGASSSSASSSGGSSSSSSNSGTSSSGASSSDASSSDASSPGTPGDAGSGGPQSVLQRGNDIFRRATYVEPGLVGSMVNTMAPDTTFDTNATFPANGNLQNQGTASVLYLEQGPVQAGCPIGATGCTATARAANGGLFFAFPALGANPNVVAFDETTGLHVWTAHVATGGDGIRGTPVIDPASRRLFVVTGNNPHMVHALSVDNGVEVTTGGWPVTLSNTTVSYNGVAFNSGAQNQHGASLLTNNILYVPFGGQYGDGGNYLGWIVAIDITNPTRIGGWAALGPKAGIWASGGLASDGTNVFGVTGNSNGAPMQTDGEEVVRVTGLAQFTRNGGNAYASTNWATWNGTDRDFGSSSPSYVPLPAGSNPPALLVAPAKAGLLYFLNGADLSTGSYPNPGGELASLVVASTTAEAVYTAPTIYSSASGLHATINVGVAPANCPVGTPTSQEMIISTLIQPGQTPMAKEVWCAPNAGGGHYNSPPISTTTDGVSANAIVWFINGAQLTAVDGDTGAHLVTTTGAPCTGVPSMGFPIAVKNRIVVAALGHLCSWSLGGL